MSTCPYDEFILLSEQVCTNFPEFSRQGVHVTDKQQPSSPTRWMHGVHCGATWPFTAKVAFPQPCVLFNFAEGHNSVMLLVKSTWMLRKKKPCAWCAHRPCFWDHGDCLEKTVMGDPTSLVQLSGDRILWCSDSSLGQKDFHHWCGNTNSVSVAATFKDKTQFYDPSHSVATTCETMKIWSMSISNSVNIL